MKTDGMLVGLPDVVRVAVHAGQVLVYPRHTPPGMFVVLAGVICRFADGTLPEAGCGDLKDVSRGPFATPAPEEIGEQACAGLAAKTDALMLFVPRSVVLSRRDVAGILTQAGIAIEPLRDHGRPRSMTTTPRRA